MTKQKKCPKQYIQPCRYEKCKNTEKGACKHTNNSPHIIINDKIFNLEQYVNDLLGNRKMSEAKIESWKGTNQIKNNGNQKNKSFVG